MKPYLQRLQEFVTCHDMIFSDTFQSNIVLMQVVNWCNWLDSINDSIVIVLLILWIKNVFIMQCIFVVE